MLTEVLCHFILQNFHNLHRCFNYDNLSKFAVFYRMFTWQGRETIEVSPMVF